jgi:hypothetical protein
LVKVDKKVIVFLKINQIVKADPLSPATGAWVGNLLDLRGGPPQQDKSSCNLDLIAAVQIAVLFDFKYRVFNISTGLFIITPVNRILKVSSQGSHQDRKSLYLGGDN